MSYELPPEPAPVPPQDEDVGVLLRLEPNGPTTVMFLRRGMPLGVVKELALGRLAPLLEGPDLVIARGADIQNERLTVGELNLAPLEYLSVGTRAEVLMAAQRGQALR